MPVGARELGVDVDERLDPIVAGRQIGHVGDRRPEIVAIDNRGRARREPLDVAAEERRTDTSDLQARLARLIVREDDVHAPGQRLAAH
jgi:hypothetical protein